MAEQAIKNRLKPLGNRVLAQRTEAKEEAKGGIILPASAKEKPETARVIAIGPGKRDKDGKLVEISVKEGDLILMDKYAGQEVTIDDEKFIIVRDEEIIAIVEE